MITLPKFTPAYSEAVERPKGSAVDYLDVPVCSACGDVAWTRDFPSGTCRACWRSLVALPLVLAAGHEIPENKL